LFSSKSSIFEVMWCPLVGTAMQVLQRVRPLCEGGRLGKIEVLLFSVGLIRRMKWFAFTEAGHFFMSGCVAMLIDFRVVLPL